MEVTVTVVVRDIEVFGECRLSQVQVTGSYDAFCGCDLSWRSYPYFRTHEYHCTATNIKFHDHGPIEHVGIELDCCILDL